MSVIPVSVWNEFTLMLREHRQDTTRALTGNGFRLHDIKREWKRVVQQFANLNGRVLEGVYAEMV